MITVKLFGLLRLQTGIKEMQMDAANIKSVLQNLENAGISQEMLAGCVFFVNNQPANKRSKLSDGDTVALMPPVAGG
jgi:molybdopterin converting factor small subunit